MKVKSVRRGIATVTAAALFGLVAPATAQAHDYVVSSNPGEGEVLSEFPDSIELNFSGDPRPNFNTIAVSDTETEEVLYTGEPTLDGHLLHLELPEDLDPGVGDYQVGFQITSSDGHATRGQVGFEVAGSEPEADAESTDVAPAVDEDEGGIPGWAIGVGAGVVVLIVAVVAGVAAVTRKKG